MDRPDRDTYARDVEQLHALRVARLVSPDGWLALVAKGFLHEGVNTLGGDPSSDVPFPKDAPFRIGTASLSAGERTVTFTPASGVPVDAVSGVSGAPSGEARVRIDAPTVMQSDAHGRATTFIVDRFTFQLMERGDVFAIRVRDPAGPARRAFRGIHRFPVEPRWKIDAEFLAHDVVRAVDLDFEGDAITHAFESPGVVTFSLPEGDEKAVHRLEVVYEDDLRRRLFVLFGDTTNGKETYGIGRFLYAPLPRGGRTVLDFNTALLPACAFTPWATCPLPPRTNKLSVPVRAGEKGVDAADEPA